MDQTKSGGNERSFVGTLLAGVAAGAVSLFALGCSGDGSFDEPTARVPEPVVWDGQAKPIPTAYLYLKNAPASEANNCRPTGNGAACTSSSCQFPCADADGLVASAGVTKTAEYYTAIGEGTLDTLQKWKDFYGFKRPGVGESLSAFRKRHVGASTTVSTSGDSSSADVVYYNDTQLALGRVLGCSKKGQNVACYVSNYGDNFETVKNPAFPDGDAENQDADGMWDAVFGVRPKNTVVISYHAGSTRPDGYRVQFAAYGADGGRITKAQLDYMGSRFIPGICITCHGGSWDITKSNAGKAGLAKDARFLPIVNTNVLFSNNAPYRLVDQEEAIRDVNAYAWATRSASLTPRQQNLLRFLYRADPTANTLNFEGLCVSGSDPCTSNADCPGGSACEFKRQWTENAWPGGWEENAWLYNHVVLPHCDSCHMALGDAMSSFIENGFDSMKTALSSFAPSFMGYNPGTSSWGSDRSTLKMPHAQPAFSRFWGDHSFPAGRSAGQQLFFDMYGVTPPAPPLSLQAHNFGTQCGQAAVNPLTQPGEGANSGRFEGFDFGTSTCMDGCFRSFNWCPGSEKAPNFAAGSRMQCVVNNIPSSGYGFCQSCGGIGTAPCSVGPGCDTQANPACGTSPACHEGVVVSGVVCGWVNIAQGKTVTQSSTFGTAVALRAIDGNTNGDFNANSVSHTNSMFNAWWKVDFGATKSFKEIEIYNRTDCCSERLSNFKVQKCTSNCGAGTSDTNWSTVGSSSGGAGLPGDFSGQTPMTNGVTRIVLPKVETARFIRIKLNGTNFLQLAEVKVLGVP